MSDRLTPIESVMWRVGQDPTLRMTIGAVLRLDGPPDPGGLIARLEAAVREAPLLACHPRPGPGLGSPSWTADRDPAVGDHVRSLALSAPGTTRQLLDVLALLEPVPFDPERSPWDVTVIEGIEQGGAALYVRAHHALTDGVGGIRLVGLLLDEPGWPGVGMAPPEVAAKAAKAAEPSGTPPAETAPTAAAVDGAAHRPGTFTVTIDLPRGVRRMLGRLDAVRRVDPVEGAMRGVQRALDVANSVARQVLPTSETGDARTNGPSMLTHFRVVSVPGALDAALAMGASRNDLLVAGAAAGLGLYHERHGEPTPTLCLVTPTSRRRPHEPGGNWFAPTRLEVPTDLSHPARQLGVVAERPAEARDEPALRLATTLATTAGRLPSRVLLSLLHAQAASVDLAATAVPGLRGNRHIGGSLIEAAYPFGPRLGCPLNVTAFANGDRLDVGIALDPHAIDDPDVLVDCVTEAFHTLTNGPWANRRGAQRAP